MIQGAVMVVIEEKLSLKQTAEILPARVVQVELGQPLPALPVEDERTGACYSRALSLVRLHSQPLGVVELELPSRGLSAEEYAVRIWRDLQPVIRAHLCGDGLAMVEPLTAAGLLWPEAPLCLKERRYLLERAPFVSVVVGTRNRASQLRKCIAPLLALRYPNYEVLIVDNAPDDTATARLVQREFAEDPRLRYLREDRPGISWARNLGLLEARGSIVAFTDDDVVVDPDWLTEMVKGFDAVEDVVCVTGLVLPLELETSAQFWYEESGGFRWFQGDGGADRLFQAQVRAQDWFSKRVFDGSKRHVHLYRAGLFGCGASMAFKADFLKSIGGFDPAMGSSGPSRCGQDIAAFFQVIMRGHKLAYEPSALVFHQHRRDLASLRRQIRNYGIGLTAYLTKNIIEFPQLLLDLCIKVPVDLAQVLLARRRVRRPKTSLYPRELTHEEYRGLVYGPLAYVQTLWKLRRIRRAAALRIKASVGRPAQS
jgi:glycosyltransferase involved in cell wall biosynthesis